MDQTKQTPTIENFGAQEAGKVAFICANWHREIVEEARASFTTKVLSFRAGL